MRQSNSIWQWILFYACARLGFATAREEVLFTSSVSYCAPPEAILVQQFDITYVARNDSVVFNVTAASVEPDLTVSANIMLNVYGMEPVNITLDFCHDFVSVLCPLPQYNFSGSGSVPLPSTFNVPSRVPSIAYKVPDLEAFAQVTLIDLNTGDIKACVQTTLSNGRSTRQGVVSWTTAAITLLAFLQYIILFYRPVNPSNALRRFLNLFTISQHICLTGLLDLNYPITYISYTLNFSWAVGLFPGWHSAQSAIDRLRSHTGGSVSAVQNPTGTANRQLSPYNDQPPFTFALVEGGRDVSSPSTVLSSQDALPAGIATFSNFLGITHTNAFMSVFFSFLLLAALFTLCLVLYGINLSIRHRRSSKLPSMVDVTQNLAFLLTMMTLTPIALFSFYQWTFHDSWFTTLLSVVCLVYLLLSIAFGLFKILRERRDNHDGNNLAYAPLIGSRRLSSHRFCCLVIFSILLRSAFVGFGQKSGAAQVALFVMTELGVLLCYCIFRPHCSRRTDCMAIVLSSIRAVSVVLLIPFITTLHVEPIPRVIIGLVNVVLLSIGIIIAVLNLLVPLLPWHLCRRRRHYESANSAGLLEKESGPFLKQDSPTPSSRMSSSPTHLT